MRYQSRCTKNMSRSGSLMLPRLLTNFKVQKYQSKPRFNGVYSRNNLSKIKDEAYVTNVDGCKSVATHSLTLYVNGHNWSALYNATCFDSFGFEHIPKEIKKLIENKDIITDTNIGIQFDNVQVQLYWSY